MRSMCSLIVLLGVYTGAVLSIVNMSFKLVTVIPDKVLKWIGGGVEQLGEMGDKLLGESRSHGVAIMTNISSQAQNAARQAAMGGGGRAGKGPGSKDGAGDKLAADGGTDKATSTEAKPEIRGPSSERQPSDKKKPDKPKE